MINNDKICSSCQYTTSDAQGNIICDPPMSECKLEICPFSHDQMEDTRNCQTYGDF